MQKGVGSTPTTTPKLFKLLNMERKGVYKQGVLITIHGIVYRVTKITKVTRTCDAFRDNYGQCKQCSKLKKYMKGSILKRIK